MQVVWPEARGTVALKNFGKLHDDGLVVT
jgi:hypothetical protein